LDLEGNQTFVNASAANMLGYEVNELAGKPSHSTWHHSWPDGSPYPAEKCPVYAAYKDGTVHTGEEMFFRKDGTCFLVRYTSRPIVTEGKIAGAVLTFNDITERKRLEEEIERLNTDLAAHAAELEAANQELEKFNYTVAHDLRQPLNVINGYCQVIMELCSASLNEPCKQYMEETYNATLRMNSLIDALLNFSQMGHAEPHREELDLCALAHEVSMNLRQTDPERQVDFRIADSILANADKHLLQVVLNNLLGNAWKFTGTKAEAIIEFGTTDNDGEQVYFVRDNGVGFDKEDGNRLFAPFQRLHGPEQFKGFGIGLATVDRIIKRHGGRIWAVGEPGMGATFYFTLQS